MKKENTLFILWIIFGFVFIEAIDSVLFLFIHLVYFGTSELGISYKTLRYIIPAISLLSYFSVTSLLLKKLKLNSNSTGIYLTEFPKQFFILLVLIAMFLGPITNRLSELFAEHRATNQIGNNTDFIELYGWMHMGLSFSRWIILIVLAYIYFNKYNTEITKPNDKLLSKN